MTIAFQEWVGYGPFYLAKDKGFTEEEGIDLVIVDQQLDSARRDAFMSGMLDCEAATLDLLVSKTAQGAPIVAVMEIDASFGSDAIVAAENIVKLEDLAGKKVALARDDVGETFISSLFFKKDMPLDTMNIVSVGPDEPAKAFLNGEADACVTWEPLVSQALQRPGAHILASSRDYPGIIIDTLNVRKYLIENNPELVKKLMRVWFKALKYYQEHPIEASAIIAKHYNVSPGQYRKQVQGLKWDSYERQKGNIESQEWLEAIKLISEIKLANTRISKRMDATQLINHKLIERLYENSR